MNGVDTTRIDQYVCRVVDPIDVIAEPAIQRFGDRIGLAKKVAPSIQGVVTIAAHQHVSTITLSIPFAGPADEGIVTCTAIERVFANVTDEGIVASQPVDGVVTGRSHE